MSDRQDQAVKAVKELSHALKELRAAGVIRSRRFTGDLGEWYVETLYDTKRTPGQTQKGWDIRLRSGDRLQIKTQSFDPSNQWNYLDSNPDLFDRFILVILTDDLTLRELYDVPVSELRPLLKVGKENKPYYYWKDLQEWRVDPATLPGYSLLGDMIERRV